jgi:hypothetical protein
VTVRRLVAPLSALGSVALVIVLLLFFNSRSAPPGAGPAIVVPHSSAPAVSASPTPPSATPAASPTLSTPVPPTVLPPTGPAPPVSEPPATTQPAVAKVPVTVLNNSRRAGLAHEVAAEVHAKGWPIAKIGNYRGRIAMTTVYYDTGQLAQARELAREFPQIKRIEPRFAGLPGDGLTLVVTRDWR